ncbi:MAG: PRC-barrel domain-containing protein, partial [Flavisolibacter sp.]|nr:PRC-barrel domain-containing protein [Flavisolibacter sp.]
HRRLQELGESDFEIVDNHPDIRGWDVKNDQNQKIGEVEELILDAQKKKVRYMVVDLDDNDFDLEDREVLIPIGMAELHKEDDDVVVHNLSAEQLRALPEYDEDHLTPDVERNICMALGRSDQTTSAQSLDMDESFYEHEHFNDNNLYRNRLPLSSPGSLMNQGVGNSGYGLRDRIGSSGSEIEGNQGTDQTSYDREKSGRREGSMFREENIREESAVPVNRNPDNDETEWRKETNIDNLTGDNNRGISDDDLGSTDRDSGRSGR